MSLNKPLPVPDKDSETFWEGCNEGLLLIQQCTLCGKHIFYPRAVCPHCMSEGIEWIESAGKGRVYSYTIARRPSHPSFANEVPYIVALIDLDEGVRMVSNIVNCDIVDLSCEMPVEVVFEDRGEIKLPKFQPV